MAVEIIGKDPRYTYRTTCPNCGSIIQCQRFDLQTKTETDYAGGRYSYTGVTCPCCRSFVTVDTYSNSQAVFSL